MTEREVNGLVRELNSLIDDDEETYSLVESKDKYYLYDNKRRRYYTKWPRSLEAMYNYLLGQIDAKS